MASSPVEANEPIVQHSKTVFDELTTFLIKSIQERDKANVEKIQRLEERIDLLQKEKVNHVMASGTAEKLLNASLAERNEYKRKYSDVKKAYELLCAERTGLDCITDIVSGMQAARRKRVGSISVDEDGDGGTPAKKPNTQVVGAAETVAGKSAEKNRSFTPPPIIFAVKKEVQDDAGRSTITAANRKSGGEHPVARLIAENQRIAENYRSADQQHRMKMRAQLSANNGKIQPTHGSFLKMLNQKLKNSTEKQKNPADAKKN